MEASVARGCGYPEMKVLKWVGRTLREHPNLAVMSPVVVPCFIRIRSPRGATGLTTRVRRFHGARAARHAKAWTPARRFDQNPHVTVAQFMRDLHWAIGSPSLIMEDPESEAILQPERLSTVGDVGAKLESFLEGRNHQRVGYYFEYLVHFWLEKVCGHEMVDQGRQIIEDGRTRGELDFVFRDGEGRLIHLETAVKFYLHLGRDNPTGSHFIGPNSSDHFERKMGRLFGKQLKLAEGLYEEKPFSLPWVKGRIFYHPQHPEVPELPERLNPLHATGAWIRAGELEGWRGWFREECCLPLHKPNWLSEQQTAIQENLVEVDDMIPRLEKHFRNSDQPRLAACMRREGDRWCETQRVFIVSDDWPRLFAKSSCGNRPRQNRS